MRIFRFFRSLWVLFLGLGFISISPSKPTHGFDLHQTLLNPLRACLKKDPFICCLSMSGVLYFLYRKYDDHFGSRKKKELELLNFLVKKIENNQVNFKQESENKQGHHLNQLPDCFKREAIMSNDIFSAVYKVLWHFGASISENPEHPEHQKHPKKEEISDKPI